MKKIYWFIAVLVLILLDIYFGKILPKGIDYALGVAMGFMIGVSLWNAIKNRKKK